ncbi:MAG: NADH:ubiquinone reductase (Na(+)-transporting) subunit C [Bacteroidales bacterium]|nr:NADH:ubiquinone reductase (Na(+)-transporting) subunit C [Bacteroidales bacterium]
MNKNSNSYIFIYAAVLVIAVAALLSTAATLLKPLQEINVKVEKMQAILASANIETTPKNAEQVYNQYIKEELVIDQQGAVISTYKSGELQGPIRAFDINMKQEVDNKAKGSEFKNPLFVCEKDGEILYVIPLRGKGLWGPVWGHVALKNDFNTIAGVVFDHKGETPGLGAEISASKFQAQFSGKTIFDKQMIFKSITVKKGGVGTLTAADQIHGVDAISGGTITSDGVNDMLRDNIENYVPYIQKNR